MQYILLVVNEPEVPTVTAVTEVAKISEFCFCSTIGIVTVNASYFCSSLFHSGQHCRIHLATSELPIFYHFENREFCVLTLDEPYGSNVSTSNIREIQSSIRSIYARIFPHNKILTCLKDRSMRLTL